MKKLTAILLFSLIPAASFAAEGERYDVADASSAQVIANYTYDYEDTSTYGYATTTESEPYFESTSNNDAPDPD